MNKIHILDCTLRDGGYYNDWNFDFDLVRRYIKTMQSLPVDIIELGFKSCYKKNIFGPHAYTTDEYLNLFGDISFPKIAVMVDAKDFLKDSDQSFQGLFKNKKDSQISVVRVAVDVDHATQCEDLIKKIKDLGYEVHLNLMQINKLSFDQIKNISQKIHSFLFDVLYIADSFGSFTPSDLIETINVLKEFISKPLGFHSHDNRGLALINSLTAMKNGVQYIDATVLGMGRGAGNVKLEALLPEIALEKSIAVDCANLLDFINDHFLKLYNTYQWGPNLLYHISGINKIHPSYAQQLIENNSYSNYDKLRSIKELSQSKKYRYNEELLSFKNIYFDNEEPGKNSLKNIQKLQDSESVLILANGPELKKYKKSIEDFILKKNPYVMSVNKSAYINHDLIDAVVCGHLSRIIIEWKSFQNCKNVILPFSNLNSELRDSIHLSENILDYGIRISPNSFVWNENYCIVPNHLSVAYALACASYSKCRKIYMAGFDGTDVLDFKETEDALELYKRQLLSKPLFSITPTNYNLEILPVIFGVSCE